MSSPTLPVEMPLISSKKIAGQENNMEDDEDFIVLKNAILLNTDQVQVREWRNFIIENWQKLTEHLENATILLVGGRHGKESGEIGPTGENLIYNLEKQVHSYLVLICFVF